MDHYGEGALIIGGKKVQYYNNIAGSIGFQIGVEKSSEVYMFLKADALKEFRNASGWSGWWRRECRSGGMGSWWCC